jgi:superfamily I DNA/RNA helicase/RecB family exonuclease
VLVLRRPDLAVAVAPALDSAQRAAVERRAPVVRVLGAPGTGKSTVAVERIVRAVDEGASADQCLLLSPTRRAAARLRDAVTARLGGTTTTPLARTHQSLGFGVLRQAAALVGDPTPRLLSGPEQDVILGELLAGHAAGQAPAPQWPADLHLALPTRTFRRELRDLLMRAVELGLEPETLAGLGHEHGRAEWVAAAHVLREYDEVTALSAAGAFDPAWVLGAAADHLEDDPDGLPQGLRLVVVDDAQELTPAGLRLVQAVVRAAPVELVLVGDPDAATETFRGADPRLFLTAWPQAPTLTLDTSHRAGLALRAAATRVVGHIGVIGGVAHRAVEPTSRPGEVEAHLLRTAAQEAGYVAGRLRHAHLIDGMPWSRMAVVVRGGSRTATLRRVLRNSGVPVDTATADLPVHDEAAVRPFLTLLRWALDIVAGGEQLDPDEVVDVLTSPVGGADAVMLRRLRRSLRRLELDSGGGRPSDVLLAEAVLAPGAMDHVGPEGTPARRAHRVLAAAVDALREGDGVEAVLWRMWSATGLAGPWRDAALGGGPSGGRADRDLDAVLGLFDAAARFVDRLPGASTADFLDHVLGQDVAGDSLVARAPAGESVALVTPAASAGREWDLVVVAGVQEGVWPDLRLRGSLLGSTDLVDVVAGRGDDPRAARAQVRHDETRLFHVAVTRARERLIVTAVRGEDEQPSAYLDVIDPLPVARSFTDVPRPLTLPGMVGELRREVAGDDPHRRGAAVTALATLAAEAVPGADPAQWWSLRDVTDDRPRRAPTASVAISPSTIDAFGRCRLQWVLRASGGDGPSIGAQDVGTLVHDVAHELGDTTAATYAAELEKRWGRLGLAPGWLSRRGLAQATSMTDRLARYVGELDATGWRRADSEARISVALGRAVISGRVDRVEVSPTGQVRIVDLKTGGTKPSQDEVRRHGQLGAYQVAVEEGGLAELGTTSGGAALLQLGKAANLTTTLQTQAPLAKDEDPAWASKVVTEVAVEMSGAVFAATPGPHCGTCQVKDSCPAFAQGRRL